MENIIDKNYKMKDKEEEEIGKPGKLFESYLAVHNRLMELITMRQAEHIKLEMLEVINQAINQAITNLEQKETLGKYTSLIGKKKRVRNSPDYSPTFAEELSADPPSLKERYSMSTTPGFKFQPNDEEIIWHLEIKRSNPCQTPSWSPIKDCPGFYVTQPGHLPDVNGIKKKKALYYYVRTKKKSGSGDRTGPSGYWRASGNNKVLSETGSEIGYKRTLKYREYADENHKSSKSRNPRNWMMHEYRLATTIGSQSHEESLEHWTICKVTWTGKNNEVTNEFSREGSIGQSENKHKNKLTMHTQNEGDLKISKIVDSKWEEIAQTNYQSIDDERRTQESEHSVQRMNREIHQSEEVTLCYASRIHPTPTTMAPKHEVETGGVEPQRFTNPGRITGEFETSFPEQTWASWFDRLLNLKFGSWEDEIRSRFDPSMPDLTSPLRTPDYSFYQDFTEREDREDGNQQCDPSWPGPNFSFTG